jgi:hypothetical protein
MVRDKEKSDGVLEELGHETACNMSPHLHSGSRKVAEYIRP